MSKTRWQPTEEEMAAFAAGRLRGAERSRMIEKLDRDPESYQLLLETLDLIEHADGLEEDSNEDEITPSAVDPRQFSASRWRVAALAASALLAVGLGWLIYVLLPQSDMAGQLAVRLSARLTSQASAAELNQQAWSEPPTRSFAGQRAAVASFRLGRLLLDLEIARLAADLSRGQSLLAEVELLLKTQRAGPIAIEEATQARRKVEAQQNLQGLEKFPERIAISLPTGWDPFFLSFGQWSEAARLASIHQQPAFFQASDFQDFVEQVQGRDDLGPQLRASWEEVRSLLGKPSLDLDDWDDLAQRWTNLIHLH